MRGDVLVETQRLMAQTIGALADHIDQATGYRLTPIPYAQLPSPAQAGMIACISDAKGQGGGVVTGGGTQTAMVFYNGTDWLWAAASATGVIRLNATTWAQLPVPSVQGMLACISDSNRNGYGQNITGSGPYFVLALYDGTNWVVH